MASTEPLNWKIIRNELRDGDIIPVIGPELLSVNINGQQQSYRHWLASELAKELGVAFDGLDGFLHPVEEVMLRHYVQGDIRSNKPYQLVKALISEQKFEVPEALKKLAQISKFRFFLTTFYEPFLEMAIKEARGLD
ncbi:MAG: hypothetical protein NTV01_22165, partial [Bacteroidia bacterium]|nr:hypothetical protein [Bacteroidia bacterium]